MANGNNATIGFEKQIWDAACVLWGHIPAAEYRKVIVGLIFLRYISNAFEKRYQELVAEGDGFEDDRDAYAEDNIFFVPEDARWSKIASAAHTPEIGTLIDNAMRAIEAENKSLKNVLPKNYASPDLDKRVLGDVVDLFTNMDMSDTKENKDLLGKTYQYCIQQFAAYEGVKGGEFYTPESIVKTIVAILKPYENCRVYDPCCGSGGMFVQSADFIEAHRGNRGKISVYGQESNADTWKMAKMNMAIRGIDANFGPYQADTFFNDLHPTLKADFIMANPPFNLSNWGQEKLKHDVRWQFGTPPAGNANYAWIQHMIHHLAPNGKIGLVLANGALSTQTSGEGEIRKRIIQADLVEGIVALPTQLFYSVTIPVTLWFISKNKKQKGKTLFIDARKMGHKLLAMTEEDFLEYISRLWAVLMWGNKKYVVDKLIEDNGFSTLKKQLADLLYGSASVEKRWDIFLKSVKGMGPATISELLSYMNPQEYIVFNKTTILCYGYLGIPNMPKYNYQYTGKKYTEVCAVAKEIASSLKKAGAADSDLLAVDYFLWDEILPLAEKDVPTTDAISISQEPVSARDSRSLHDEIKDKLVDIGKLLGFDSRSEVKIATGAVVDAVWEAKIGNMGKAIYVFEVQSKGSIDSLILNLKKAQSNAAVQAVVAVADEEQLAKIIQESAGVIDEKSLRTWDSEDVLAVYDALVRAHESINKLALVPESF